jgi:sarcosine oxidase, subunit delta
MLRLPCPFCGVRDEIEFAFGGTAHIARPDAGCTDEAWAAYLYHRSNPKGLHFERWCHTFGCGQWFNVARDTVTHEVHAVYRMGEAPP